jgi:hypothetical protein
MERWKPVSVKGAPDWSTTQQSTDLKMDRDDFSKQTRDRLAMRVGVRCSNPFCRKLTTGPRIESPHIINIGVGAHITAASSGGPRYDLSLSSEQRESAENGIWLCQNCAKLIDNDPKRYPAEVLQEWKVKAEAWALAELEGQAAPQPTDSSAEIDINYAKKRITGERHDYCLQVTLTNRGTEPLGAYHIDLVMPALVVSSPEAQPSYVRENSTRDVAFFRVSSRDSEQQIYPGDTKLVISIPYYVDRKIYWENHIDWSDRRNRVDLFEQPVKATLYHYGFRPLTLERCFGEFQIF